MAAVSSAVSFAPDSLCLLNQEPDSQQWSKRLHLHGVDFRFTNRLVDFLKFFQRVYRCFRLVAVA